MAIHFWVEMGQKSMSLSKLFTYMKILSWYEISWLMKCCHRHHSIRIQCHIHNLAFQILQNIFPSQYVSADEFLSRSECKLCLKRLKSCKICILLKNQFPLLSFIKLVERAWDQVCMCTMLLMFMSENHDSWTQRNAGEMVKSTHSTRKGLLDFSLINMLILFIHLQSTAMAHEQCTPTFRSFNAKCIIKRTELSILLMNKNKMTSQ